MIILLITINIKTINKLTIQFPQNYIKNLISFFPKIPKIKIKDGFKILFFKKLNRILIFRIYFLEEIEIN